MSLTEAAPGKNARRWPHLGSLEHILYFAQVSKTLKPKTPVDLYVVLSEYHVAESLAYFIAQNETPKGGSSDHHISLDTRDLHGYRHGPIIDAEFHYDPFQEENYVFLYGRPSARTRTSAYHLKMYMQDDLELDTSHPPEAYWYKGRPQNKSYQKRIFRTNTFPEYKEDRPSAFLSVLRVAAAGLENFVDARDNF